jgi:hypothetical protein
MREAVLECIKINYNRNRRRSALGCLSSIEYEMSQSS